MEDSYETFQCSDHLKAATETQSHSYNAVTPGPRLEMNIEEWAERSVGGKRYIEMLHDKLSLNGNLNHGMCS